MLLTHEAEMGTLMKTNKSQIQEMNLIFLKVHRGKQKEGQLI